MAKYKLTENGVFDTEKEFYIPDNETNRHWLDYLEWVAAGNTPDPMDIVEPVVDPRIAMIDEILTINDVKDFLKVLINA